MVPCRNPQQHEDLSETETGLKKAEVQEQVMKQLVLLRAHTGHVWKNPEEQQSAVGGGVTGDFLLYTFVPKFSTVNIYCLYKLNQILFF